MICYQCGADIGDNLGLCPVCREARAARHEREAAEATLSPHDNPYAQDYVEPAGFWLRVLAKLIDSNAVAILQLAIFSIVAAPFSGKSIAELLKQESSSSSEFSASLAGALLVAFLVLVAAVAVAFVYSACFESSSLRATPGKYILGLEVCDLEGETLTLWHASGRFLAKLLSYATLLVGFLMVGFSPEKRGLHDIVAKTQVLKGERYSPSRIAPAVVTVFVLGGLSKGLERTLDRLMPDDTQTVVGGPSR